LKRLQAETKSITMTNVVPHTGRGQMACWIQQSLFHQNCM